MTAPDVNALFSRAEQAFAAGRFDEARDDLIRVGSAAGEHPAVLHLLALVEKRRGDTVAAQGAFERAAALAPHDPHILSNHANLLDSIGDKLGALALYDRAIELAPAFADARLNRALLLQKLGRCHDALRALDDLGRTAAPSARLASARAAVLKQLGRLDDAANAFDEALALEPRRPVALRGRARVAMERGEADASRWYRRALADNPDNRELLLGLAEALNAEGDETSLALLSDATTRWPDWIAGHEGLAMMRAEAGHGDAFADHFRTAITRRPADLALHQAYWAVLAKADRPHAALEQLRVAKSRFGDLPESLLTEAVLASEAEETSAADAIFKTLPEHGAILSARGRNALRVGDAAQAADLLDRAVQREPGLIAAWAHLDLAWRLIGDARHDWLSGQLGLYECWQLPFDAADLQQLAAILRGLHRTRAHPIGQSLRGGTQTRGRLFWRREPELSVLREAIEEAVTRHVRALPPADSGHPLLKHRDESWTVGGSWSVRLLAQGFHVNHIHPEGVLSSACYISLPDGLGDDAAKDGWLDIGAPPRELGLALEPLATIEPKPGRLALFPSYLFHGTRPFERGERLTVAFDILPG